MSNRQFQNLPMNKVEVANPLDNSKHMCVCNLYASISPLSELLSSSEGLPAVYNELW